MARGKVQTRTLTDAGTSVGGSGGPACLRDGKVIGIVLAVEPAVKENFASIFAFLEVCRSSDNRLRLLRQVCIGANQRWFLVYLCISVSYLSKTVSTGCAKTHNSPMHLVCLVPLTFCVKGTTM